MSLLRRINCAEATDRAAFFVLGALDAGEAIEVRDHLETCPNEHPEFKEFGGVVPYLADALEPLEPSPELRRRVIDAVEGDVRVRRRDENAAERLVASFGAGTQARPATSGAPPAPAAAPAPIPVEWPEAEPTAETAPRPSPVAPMPEAEPAIEPRTVPERRRSRLPALALGLAAVVVIGVLAGWNLMLLSSATDARHRAEVLRDAMIASQDPGARVAQLSGTGSASGAGGFVAVPADGDGYLVVHGLEPPPADQTYQAWFISGDQPRSAGLLRVGDDGLAIVEGLRPGGSVDAIGITLEKAGGSPSPTLPVLVQGVMQDN
jgi:anti-sigma-K factor RskA